MLAHLVRLPGLVIVALTMGCAWHAAPVPVFGTPADLERLSGEWRGSYFGDHNHQRNGTVVFKLRADADGAAGDVIMTKEGLDRPYQHSPYETGTPPPARPQRELSIRFVHTEDGVVIGELDPYWDPDRKSAALTTFRGRLIDEHTITGTFTTRYATGTASTGGTWKVARRTAGSR